MDTKIDDPKAGNLRPSCNAFPYVSGWLFADSLDGPRFSRIAGSCPLRAAELNWQEVNPHFFGSPRASHQNDGPPIVCNPGRRIGSLRHA